ncbi:MULTISPECIES: GDP-mannose 4,6-dehydratase, partial [unclassified Methanosarcina]
DPGYYRPTEVELLIGDPSKAREKLGWQPKVKMGELVKIMIKSDEEEVLKNYPSEKLAACQELKENLAENPKLNLKSL